MAVRRPKGSCHPDRMDDGWPAPWIGNFRYQVLPAWACLGLICAFPTGVEPLEPRKFYIHPGRLSTSLSK